MRWFCWMLIVFTVGYLLDMMVKLFEKIIGKRRKRRG